MPVDVGEFDVSQPDVTEARDVTRARSLEAHVAAHAQHQDSIGTLLPRPHRQTITSSPCGESPPQNEAV